MTNDGGTSESGTSGGSQPSAPARPSPLIRLADLDRRIVPVVAMRLDRLLPGSRGAAASRLALGRTERRILGALALLLLGCAVALAVVGG